jgi:hypothetical protein
MPITEHPYRNPLAASQETLELRKIAFANMADYMKSTPEGDPYLDFSTLTPAQTAALAEVTVEDYVEGRGKGARAVKRVKFKLHDKLGALDKLGRHLGLFDAKHKQPDVPIEVTAAPPSLLWVWGVDSKRPSSASDATALHRL